MDAHVLDEAVRIVLPDVADRGTPTIIGERVRPLLRVDPLQRVTVAAPFRARYAGLDDVINRRLRDVLQRDTERWQCLLADADRAVSAVDFELTGDDVEIVSVNHGEYADRFDQTVRQVERMEAPRRLPFDGPERAFEVASLVIPALGFGAVHLSIAELGIDYLLPLGGPLSSVGDGRLLDVKELESELFELAVEVAEQWRNATPPDELLR